MEHDIGTEQNLHNGDDCVKRDLKIVGGIWRTHSEAQQETRLSNPRVTDEQQLEEIVAAADKRTAAASHWNRGSAKHCT